jgi:peptidoglycan/LPS O-acetylase OafA/YrhL
MLITHVSFEAITALTVARMDSLAVGAFVALAARGQQLRELASQARLVAITCSPVFILICYIALHGGWAPEPKYDIYNLGLYSIGLTALAFFYGALLIVALAASHETWIARIFDFPGLRFFGKYSYGLYVFHFFVALQFARIIPPQDLIHIVQSESLGALLFISILFLVSVSMAVLSWHMYEKQFLKLKRFFEYEMKKR